MKLAKLKHVIHSRILNLKLKRFNVLLSLTVSRTQPDAERHISELCEELFAALLAADMLYFLIYLLLVIHP